MQMFFLLLLLIYIYIKMTAALTDSGGAAVCLKVWFQNAEQVLLGDSVLLKL